MTPEDLHIIYSRRPYALKLSGCVHDANDIIQEVALSVLRNYDRFKNFTEAGKRGYVTTCIGSKFIDLKRKVQRKNRDSVHLYQKIQPDGMASKFEMEAVEKAWKDSEVCDSLKLFIAGYKVKEIKEMVSLSEERDVSINTVTGYIRYGRNHLRKQLNYEQK